jgi:hypothetical protein
MSGKLDRTVNVGKYKSGEAQVRTILGSQGLDAKTIVLKSNDNHSESWDIVLSNGKKKFSCSPTRKIPQSPSKNYNTMGTTDTMYTMEFSF